jgi:hypothetical protein
VLFTVAKLQDVTSGITYKTAWATSDSSLPDPDVWLRLSKRSTGEEYYEYVLLYVDDVLVISESAEKVLRNEIGQHFVLGDESIGPPSQYLGGKLRLVTLDNGVKACVG